MQNEVNARPQIEIIPIRAAVKSNEATDLTVLLRITPPAMEVRSERPRLNVGLVLDRSGSMAGSKLKAVKQAATYALSQLAPTDRLSVTVYDDDVQTIVPSQLVTAKSEIEYAINRIEVAGCTNLQGGWLEGAVQVSTHLDTAALNRVLLLTDGLANAGVTQPDAICNQVKGLSQRGVSTSTFGVGTDFNEDLLQSMQEAGDGNYYFIEGAADLERIFAAEFHGLMATLGQKVSLGIEPASVKGIESNVLNDLPCNELGRTMLPNLVVGNTIEILVSLTIPAQEKETDLCFFRLAWDAPGGGRQVLREALSLPVMKADDWKKLEENVLVKRQLALHTANSTRATAIEFMKAGNVQAARGSLKRMEADLMEEFDVSDMLGSLALSSELKEIQELDERLAGGEVAAASKIAKFKSYRAKRGV